MCRVARSPTKQRGQVRALWPCLLVTPANGVRGVDTRLQKTAPRKRCSTVSHVVTVTKMTTMLHATFWPQELRRQPRDPLCKRGDELGIPGHEDRVIQSYASHVLATFAFRRSSFSPSITRSTSLNLNMYPICCSH